MNNTEQNGSSTDATSQRITNDPRQLLLSEAASKQSHRMGHSVMPSEDSLGMPLLPLKSLPLCV